MLRMRDVYKCLTLINFTLTMLTRTNRHCQFVTASVIISTLYISVRVQLGYPNFFMVATKLSLRKKISGNITERGFGSCEKALKKIGPRMGGAKK